jgi:hypothetical protein
MTRPESEAPPRIPSREELDDGDRHWFRGCNAELDPMLAEHGLCTRCQAAPTERPPEPTLAHVYNAIMGIAEDMRAMRRMVDSIAALQAFRHPEDAHLFREDANGLST